MHLNAITYGPETAAAPLVIAHGLFGSARNWSAIAKRLALRRRVVVVDMRNHGDSPRSPVHGYAAMAEDLAETIAGAGGRADLMGHSMGGKAAMMLALTEPARVNRLIVADMAPVAYGHSQIGYVRAMQALDLAGITRRSEADAAAGRGGAGTESFGPSFCRASPWRRAPQAGSSTSRRSGRKCRRLWDFPPSRPPFPDRPSSLPGRAPSM